MSASWKTVTRRIHYGYKLSTIRLELKDIASTLYMKSSSSNQKYLFMFLGVSVLLFSLARTPATDPVVKAYMCQGALISLTVTTALLKVTPDDQVENHIKEIIESSKIEPTPTPVAPTLPENHNPDTKNI